MKNTVLVLVEFRNLQPYVAKFESESPIDIDRVTDFYTEYGSFNPNKDVLTLLDNALQSIDLDNPPNPVKMAYVNGICPDCGLVIPDDIEDGGECVNCGHVFYK
jgi:hypothetical protein